ncbi:MAG TPA: NAD(P)/FAD-dependent oxidoreductase [Amycolatopsis sp.]|nr:NAD(P)/FAD-dependent oxidoreductase [Amycolatopsis sp.]
MTAVEASPGVELREASDEQIEGAVAHADPMVLRGLLYQLTGDENLATMALTTFLFGWVDVVALADPADVELVREKAVALLKTCRDGGAGRIDIGPAERLPRSLALVAGVDRIPDEDLALWLEELALDPWARALEWEDVPPAERLRGLSVVVIGAGMGGLNAAVQLQHAGIDYTVIEKNAGVGGTWFENRYPGARVDSPSRAYTHIFGTAFHSPYPFCRWIENTQYFDWVADNFGVRDRITFGTEVTSVAWDDDAAEWEVTANGPDGRRVWRANVVISAVGFLNRPNLPQIEGMSRFAGPTFHTARWPQELDLRGKRVAVVGTGCTGYQIIPELALEAGHVHIFQRRPQWVFDVPGYRSPYPPQVTWLDRNFPFHVNFMRFLSNWLNRPEVAAQQFDVDPGFQDPHARSAFNKQMREGRIEFLAQKLAGRPELVEKMTPPHPPFSARPVVVDSEYSVVDALLRDNVTLVTDGIRRITPTGIETADGAAHEVDVIVYATGFQANRFLWPMEVRGRGGRQVEEVWSEDGPRAYIGTMVPGFPNFFMIYGPNTNPFGGGLGVVNHEEMITRFALECVRHLVVTGQRSVEVGEAAYRRYNRELDERDALKVYCDPRADNYYRNEHGRSATNCPFPATDMWHRLRKPDLDDLIVR